MRPSLHSTTIYFPIFTSLHCLFDDPPFHFALFITFLTLFIKLLGLQESLKHLQVVGSRAEWSYLHNVKILAHPMHCITALKTKGLQEKKCIGHMKCVSPLSTTIVPINIRRVTPEKYAKADINPHVTLVTFVQLKKNWIYLYKLQ
jgi:hypothetical protein